MKLSKKYFEQIISPELSIAGNGNFKKFIKDRESSVTLTEENDSSISYKLNGYGYRSDQFKNNAKTLFAGCSHTFGIGLPIEYVWTSMLGKELGNREQFNLGVCGASFSSIIDNIYSYINDFGKPEELFVLFPNIERFEKVIESSGDVFLAHTLYAHRSNKEEVAVSDVVTYEHMLMLFVRSVRALEAYCDAAGIRLYWATWDVGLNKTITNVKGFRRYVSIFNGKNSPEYVDHALKHGDRKHKYWLKAADGHPGIRDHVIYTRAFLDAYKNSAV